MEWWNIVAWQLSPLISSAFDVVDLTHRSLIFCDNCRCTHIGVQLPEKLVNDQWDEEHQLTANAEHPERLLPLLVFLVSVSW